MPQMDKSSVDWNLLNYFNKQPFSKGIAQKDTRAMYNYIRLDIRMRRGGGGMRGEGKGVNKEVLRQSNIEKANSAGEAWKRINI